MHQASTSSDLYDVADIVSKLWAIPKNHTRDDLVTLLESDARSRLFKFGIQIASVITDMANGRVFSSTTAATAAVPPPPPPPPQSPASRQQQHDNWVPSSSAHLNPRARSPSRARSPPSRSRARSPPRTRRERSPSSRRSPSRDRSPPRRSSSQAPFRPRTVPPPPYQAYRRPNRVTLKGFNPASLPPVPPRTPEEENKRKLNLSAWLKAVSAFEKDHKRIFDCVLDGDPKLASYGYPPKDTDDGSKSVAPSVDPPLGQPRTVTAGPISAPSTVAAVPADRIVISDSRSGKLGVQISGMPSSSAMTAVGPLAASLAEAEAGKDGDDEPTWGEIAANS